MKNIKLASAARDLSNRYSDLYEEHALKSVVNNVVMDVLKYFYKDDVTRQYVDPVTDDDGDADDEDTLSPEERELAAADFRVKEEEENRR
jgi:hypothetical protein